MTLRHCLQLLASAGSTQWGPRWRNGNTWTLVWRVQRHSRGKHETLTINRVTVKDTGGSKCTSVVSGLDSGLEPNSKLMFWIKKRQLRKRHSVENENSKSFGRWKCRQKCTTHQRNWERHKNKYKTWWPGRTSPVANQRRLIKQRGKHTQGKGQVDKWKQDFKIKQEVTGQ